MPETRKFTVKPELKPHEWAKTLRKYDSSPIKNNINKIKNESITNKKYIEAINKLEKIFISQYSNQSYLKIWFQFFLKDFFVQNTNIKLKEFKWLQEYLSKLKNNKNEVNFNDFKLKKEKFFPWNQKIKFKLLKSTIELEIKYENEILAIEHKLKNLEKNLSDKISEYWNDIDLITNITFRKNEILEERKILENKKVGKFKNFIIKVFTFGCYDKNQVINNKLNINKMKNEKLETEKTTIEAKMIKNKEDRKNLTNEICKLHELLKNLKQEQKEFLKAKELQQKIQIQNSDSSFDTKSISSSTENIEIIEENNSDSNYYTNSDSSFDTKSISSSTKSIKIIEENDNEQWEYN